jgi:Flp pilus assembly pilin Flp
VLKLSQDRAAAVAAFIYIALGLVGMLVLYPFESVRLEGCILLLAVMLVCLIIVEVRRVGHFLTPAGILAVGGLLLFVLRPLTILDSGYTTATNMAQTQVFTGPLVSAGSLAQLQVGLWFSAFGLVYFFWLFHPRFERQNPATASQEVTTSAAVGRARLLVIGAAILAATLSATLVTLQGGISTFFEGLSNRSGFLSGLFFFTIGYLPLTVALSGYLLTRRRRPDLKVWDSLAVSALVVLILSAFATGGRGPLLLGVIVPMLILKQAGPKPLRMRHLVLIGLGTVIAAMVMSIVLRENVYSQGEALADLTTDPIGTLGQRLTSGSETRPFDSLILLNSEDAKGNLQPQLGLTYVKDLTYFVPSSVYPGKDGGANAWFTRTFAPSFYYPYEVETSISAIGEGYANFWHYGILLSGAIVGFVASRIGLRPGQTMAGQLYAVTLTPLFFSFMRGDSYQNLPTILLTAGAAALVLKVIHPD